MNLTRPVALLSFVLAPLALGATALAACSDDDATPAAPTEDGGNGADAKKRVDGEPDPNETLDSSADAPQTPIILPSCVGTSLPMKLDGVRAFVNVAMRSEPDGGFTSKGNFVVDYGTTSSTIDLKGFGDAGSEAPIPESCNGDASAPGAACQFQGFDFFGDWGRVYLSTADHGTLFGAIRQAGIIATDFLSLYPHTLDFKHNMIYRSEIAAFCTDTQLLGAGFRPVSTKGFFTTNPQTGLRPLSEVLDDPDGGTKNFTVPNVPTVAITIAGVAAIAQLDTGYEDRLERRSINVNEALFAQLNTTPGLLTRDALIDLYVTTCEAGLNEQLEGYHLPPGKTLEFIGEGGSVARVDSAVAVYLKHRRADTKKCGGISTWTVPAAQVGASFFIDAQALIIDPASSRVWIPKN